MNRTGQQGKKTHLKGRFELGGHDLRRAAIAHIAASSSTPSLFSYALKAAPAPECYTLPRVASVSVCSMWRDFSRHSVF